MIEEQLKKQEYDFISKDEKQFVSAFSKAMQEIGYVNDGITPYVCLGRCKQCDKSGGGIGKKGKCSFKKTYTIDGIIYMKCAGENYYFANHDLYVIPKYIELIETFYPVKIKNQTK